MYQDTIAAIATAVGEGSISVIRLSGNQASHIAEKMIGKKLRDRRITFAQARDTNGEVVDEVVVALMKGPHSYTKEDVVEISCHGGHLPAQKIMKLCLSFGARQANPGEFTLRSFLNGRIDLAQAEAVLDIVQANTNEGLRLAVGGLAGRLSEPVKDIKGKLLLALAYLTAKIDFPEDEVDTQAEVDIPGLLDEARQALHELIENADAGIIYRQGIRAAIVGRPNVGKSSLLNRLLGSDRAIVTPIAGTTRDTLEESANVNGIPFVLVDTAGIRETLDPIETVGVERTRKAISQASLVLFVVDASQPVSSDDMKIASDVKDFKVVLIANKCDIAKPSSFEWLGVGSHVAVSALTGVGIENLRDEIARRALNGKLISSDQAAITNPRHKVSLETADAHLDAAQISLAKAMPDDFVTIDLKAALNALGEITGENVSEELLNEIFSRFCVGK
ncbi:MAG: tRNA uridine-5-carboxymethylaminomethyl(34) synthesis GTPase MnmE [Dehalococcoidia bacterium]|nr:tRNA uridine-5-carboxymethylaminomethyl(34) synthesis GTPase MnmE [Dehalococcoidia bacterium]